MKIKSILIELTNSCQFNGCVYCSSNSVYLWENRIVVDKDVLNKLLHEIVDLGVEEVEISGGEPITVLSLLTQCLDYLRNFDIKVKIFTNLIYHSAILEEKILKRYKSSVAKIEFHFPLNTTDITIFSKLTRNDLEYMSKYMNFNKYEVLSDVLTIVCKNVKKIREYEYSVNIHFLVTKVNYMEYPKVIEFANEMDIDTVSFLRLVKHGRAVKYWNVIEMDKQDWINFFKSLEKYLLEYYGKTVLRFGCPINWFHLFPNHVRDILLVKKNLKLSFKCLGGVNHLCIVPTLDIYPCVGAKDFEVLKLGNYRKLNKLIDLFGTKEFENYLKLKEIYIDETCHNCPHYGRFCDSKCLVQKIIHNTKVDPLCKILKEKYKNI